MSPLPSDVSEQVRALQTRATRATTAVEHTEIGLEVVAIYEKYGCYNELLVLSESNVPVAVGRAARDAVIPALKNYVDGLVRDGDRPELEQMEAGRYTPHWAKVIVRAGLDRLSALEKKDALRGPADGVLGDASRFTKKPVPEPPSTRQKGRSAEIVTLKH